MTHEIIAFERERILTNTSAMVDLLAESGGDIELAASLTNLCRKVSNGEIAITAAEASVYKSLRKMAQRKAEMIIC